MIHTRSAELRQQRRRLIAETILPRRAPPARLVCGSAALYNVLRRIRRPDVERQPDLSDIQPRDAAWGAQ